MSKIHVSMGDTRTRILVELSAAELQLCHRPMDALIKALDGECDRAGLIVLTKNLENDLRRKL